MSNIELFLNYCLRFYDRQFITRTNINKDILSRFESYLMDYIHSNRPAKEGLPTVAMMASELHISPNYLGDLIKKETGLSAQNHIHNALIAEAKQRIFDPAYSISGVAYSLGFQYPQHFSRFFKKETGKTPGQYRGN